MKAGEAGQRAQDTTLALLYASLPMAVGSNILLASLLVLVIWPMAAPVLAGCWLALMVAAQCARLWLLLQYRRAGEAAQIDAAGWLKFFRVGAIGSGVLWGAGVWLLFPADAFTQQIFMAFVLAGLTAGAVTSLAPDRRSALGFVACALVPLSIAFLLQGSGMSLAMSAMILLFLGFAAASGSRLRQAMLVNEALIQGARNKQGALDAQHRLAAVITNAQSQFIRNADRRRAFDKLLTDVLDLTGSDYGFIGEVLRTAEGRPYLKTYAITDIAWNDDTRDFYKANAPQGMEFFNLETLFGAALSSGEPIIANDPLHDPRRGGLPAGHPALNAFLGVPVHHGGELIAMIGIANRPGGYDQALLDFLHPLLVTIGQLIAAARTQRRHGADQLELARLSRVANQTTNGVIITDIEGRVEWINQGFTRITGYTLEDIQGHKPGALLQGPATDPATLAEIRAALAHGEGFEVDLVNYTRDRKPYWIRIQCNPLRDENGVLQGFMAIESDVTREKEALELVRASERRLASVIEGTNIGTWEWNVQSGETVFNERWAGIVGYTLEELAPISIQTWMGLAHPVDLALSGELLERHFAGNLDFYDCTARVRHKEGHWVWVHDRGRVVSWTADGKPLLMSGTHADVTVQKQAEQALRDSEARLRGLFELSPIGIALNDFETGEFMDLNEALLRPSGYTREEFIALSYWDVTPREYEPKEMQQLESMERSGRYGPYEKEYISKDGSRYPVLLNGMVVHDHAGRKLIWSIIEDVSERKRIERMKNEFISTVSHELRTPLTAISGALGLMVGGAVGTLPEQMREMLEIAHKNSQRLGCLIDDLLDMEKLVAGKMHFEMQVQALYPLLERAVRDNQGYADRYRVRLVLDAADDGIRVEVDADRLQQVLANLLSNAAKFSPEGGEVTVVAASGERRVRVSVADRGSGIPEEFRARIFEKFSQADASDVRQKGGSGLGLAITRELVEHMDGRIGFDSVEGAGATFWVELPLIRPGGAPESSITPEGADHE